MAECYNNTVWGLSSQVGYFYNSRTVKSENFYFQIRQCSRDLVTHKVESENQNYFIGNTNSRRPTWFILKPKSGISPQKISYPPRLTNQLKTCYWSDYQRIPSLIGGNKTTKKSQIDIEEKLKLFSGNKIKYFLVEGTNRLNRKFFSFYYERDRMLPTIIS